MYNPGMAHFMPGGGARSRTDQMEMAKTVAPLLAAVEAELHARQALVEARKADIWFFEHLLYALTDDHDAIAVLRGCVRCLAEQVSDGVPVLHCVGRCL